MTFRALVIGAGNIGARYDRPDSTAVLSHCGAYSRSTRTELVGVVDADPERAESAARMWETDAYTSVTRAIAAASPDIVSVCVPTDLHLAVVEEVLETRPEYLFLEKPLATRLADARRLVAAVGPTRCAVNYIRRFAPGVATLRARIRAHEFGRLLNGSAVYTKGISNTGSHLIDLIHFLFGEIAAFQILCAVEDYAARDPTLGMRLTLATGGAMQIIPADERCYSVFECDLFFEKARVTLTNFGFGLLMRTAQADPLFPGYRALGADAPATDTGLDRAMLHAVEQIAGHLAGGAATVSGLADAFKTEVAVSMMLQAHQARSGVEHTIAYE